MISDEYCLLLNVVSVIYIMIRKRIRKNHVRIKINILIVIRKHFDDGTNYCFHLFILNFQYISRKFNFQNIHISQNYEIRDNNNCWITVDDHSNSIIDQ